jgi:hypothetical protein
VKFEKFLVVKIQDRIKVSALFFAIIKCIALLRYFKLKPNVLFSLLKTFVKIQRFFLILEKPRTNKNVPK